MGNKYVYLIMMRTAKRGHGDTSATPLAIAPSLLAAERYWNKLRDSMLRRGAQGIYNEILQIGPRPYDGEVLQRMRWEQGEQCWWMEVQRWLLWEGRAQRVRHEFADEDPTSVDGSLLSEVTS